MSKLNEIIAFRLLRCRKEKGWKLAEIADKVGATLHQYSNWERGLRPVSLEYLHKLALVFEKDGAWLAGFSDEEDKKCTTIKINDNLMKDDILKDDLVYIDTSITQPITTDMFAIKANEQVLVRWVRPEFDGSYTIKALNENLWPSIKVEKEDIKNLKILGRVNGIKRKI